MLSLYGPTPWAKIFDCNTLANVGPMSSLAPHFNHYPCKNMFFFFFLKWFLILVHDDLGLADGPLIMRRDEMKSIANPCQRIDKA